MIVLLILARCILITAFCLSFYSSLSLATTSSLGERINWKTVGPNIVCMQCLVIINNVMFKGALPPVPLDVAMPVLTIGVSLSLSGVDKGDIAADSEVPGLLQFAADYVNSHGGVAIGIMPNQTIYRLRFMYADDQSSVAMMRLIYAEMINQGIEIFMGPFGDHMQQPLNTMLLSINQSINVSIVSSLAQERRTYDSGLTNLFGVIGTADQYHPVTINTLDQIVRRNQANMLSSSTASDITSSTKVEIRSSLVDDITSSEPVGITSICLFAPDTTLAMALREGVLDWIESSNGARAAQSLNQSTYFTPVSLIVDVTLPHSIYLPSDYARYISMCPPNTDLAIIPLNYGSIHGLKLSNVRFNAVMDLFQGAQAYRLMLDYGIAAEGWISWLPDIQITAPADQLFISPLQVSFLYAYYKSGQVIITSAASAYSFSRIAEIAFIINALNHSQSASRVDFRAGMLSLNGLPTILGIAQFNETTGINEGTKVDALALIQLQKDGSLRGLNASGYTGEDPLYPYDWPFGPPRYGDQVIAHQEAVPLLLALLVAGIGTWLAFILYEQSMFGMNSSQLSSNHSSHRLFDFFLFQGLSAHVISSVGIVLVQIMLSSALTVTFPDSATGLDITLSLTQALPGFCCCLAASVLAYLVISDYFPFWWEKIVKRCSRMYRVAPLHKADSKYKLKASERRMRLRAQRAQATLQSTYTEELIHLLKISMRPSYVLGGAFMATGVGISRFNCFLAWQQDAYFDESIGVWIATSVICTVLFSVILSALAHAFKWRIPAVFLCPFTVIIDWEIHILMARFAYDPSASQALHSFEKSAAQVIVISIAALTVVLCLVVQYSRMRMTHKGLRKLVSSREKDYVRANDRKLKSEAEIKIARQHIYAFVSVIQSITLAVTQPVEYALVLAVCHKPGTVLHQSSGGSSSAPTRRLGLTMSSDDESVAMPSRSPLHMLSPSATSATRTSRPALAIAKRPTLRRSGTTRFPPKGHTSHSSISSTPGDNHSPHFYVDPVDTDRFENTTFLALDSPTVTNRWSADGRFSLSTPLAGPQSESNLPIKTISFHQMLSHPCCIEVFKEVALKKRSLENLTFYLLARKYSTLGSPLLRRFVAKQLYNTFIVAGSREELNLSTSQRKSIESRINQEEFDADLFFEAEQECFRLMEANLFDKFASNQSTAYRLACWLYALIPVDDLGETWLNVQRDGMTKRHSAQKSLPPILLSGHRQRALSTLSERISFE